VFHIHKEVEQKAQRCYTENEILSMLEFLLDYLFVEFRVHLFQQIIDQHPQGNNMCPFPCHYLWSEVYSNIHYWQSEPDDFL